MMTLTPFLMTKRLKFCDHVIIDLPPHIDIVMNSVRMESLTPRLFIAQELQATT